MKDTLYNYVALQVSRADPDFFQSPTHLVKCAMNPYLAYAMVGTGNKLINGASSAVSAAGRGLYAVGNGAVTGYGRAVSGAEGLGYSLGDTLQSTIDYLGPDKPVRLSAEDEVVSNLINNIKDTEQAEQYLREAEKLRRRTRIRLRREKRDEQLRKTVADSRFF